MGGWKLEVGKMALYLSFPLVAFHIFNQPAYFEKWVIANKRIFYPPEDRVEKKMIEDLKMDFLQQRNQEILSALHDYDAKNN